MRPLAGRGRTSPSGCGLSPQHSGRRRSFRGSPPPGPPSELAASLRLARPLKAAAYTTCAASAPGAASWPPPSSRSRPLTVSVPACGLSSPRQARQRRTRPTPPRPSTPTHRSRRRRRSRTRRRRRRRPYHGLLTPIRIVWRLQEDYKFTEMVSCCVPGCRSERSKVKSYVLPQEKERRIKWCLAICRLDLIDVHPFRRRQYRVCELHFTQESLFAGLHNKTNLKHNSIPTLSLPGLRGKWMDTYEMVQPEDGTSLTAESQFEELDIKQSFDECGVHDCVCKMARDYYYRVTSPMALQIDQEKPLSCTSVVRTARAGPPAPAAASPQALQSNRSAAAQATHPSTSTDLVRRRGRGRERPSSYPSYRTQTQVQTKCPPLTPLHQSHC
ncbi:hypothetical protein WN55_01322 [Dufourea novaeangliae]|uniref:THAP-type domain-containing protein n=1 Tax=Dufourea novaeangliae TaxID=178035 RepID=A0A154PDX7_DUFNO|nr:hypothetical protein WN55_01322 [Dufourea novaeangliae]